MIKIDKKDEIYPNLLSKIKNMPEQLYVKGNIQLLNKPAIAIIGTRKNSSYGERMTIKFARELSEYGLTIISGMAIGIDTIAHKETIKSGGQTIAVLPSGFEHIYPKENIELYNQILENDGLIITEYEEKVEADSEKFIERNRIVSGMSIGILVIEGGVRSGTSVTARLAKEQGKKVFCIPSSLENSKGITPNNLIKKGGILVTDVNDIIKQYPELKLKKKKIKVRPILDDNVKEEYKDIYNIIPSKGTIHIDKICEKLEMKIEEINYKIMMLELDEKIVSLPGKMYKRK